MSQFKKDQAEAFFTLHPDTRLVEKLNESDEVVYSFPGLFDMAHDQDNKDVAGVGQIKYIPHLTFFSGHAGEVRTRGTRLRVHETKEKNDATASIWKVYRVDDDRTQSTFQAEARFV